MQKRFLTTLLAGVMAASLTTTASAASATDFTDVKPSDWFYSAVDHVVSHNYFNGTSGTEFTPNGSMTRAMAVTVLSRMFGGDMSQYDGKTTFSDVPSDAYYAKAVQWAVAHGITNGTSATTFSPDSNVTREQIATFFFNTVKDQGCLGSYDASVMESFPDKNEVSSWASEAMAWATTNSLVKGSGGLLIPKSNTTRAMTATIIMNYDNTYTASGGNTQSPDPVCHHENTAAVNGKAATCTEPGISDGVNCLDCGEVITAQVTLPALGHDYTSFGMCSRCGILDPSLFESPDEEDELAAMEQAIRSGLESAWGSKASNVSYDAGCLTKAARLIASQEETDVVKALQAVGFDKPVGTVHVDAYTTSRYDVAAYTTTSSDVEQRLSALMKKENLMDTYAFTDYGIGVYQLNAFRYTVTVVTYSGDPYTSTDKGAYWSDWVSGQQGKAVNATSDEQRVLALVNAERAKYGLAPLSMTADMQAAAHARAAELPVSFSHNRPGGGPGFGILNEYGLVTGHAAYCSENLASGCATPEIVVSGWLNSPNHRAAILSEKAEYIGIGRSGNYWVQLFIGTV